MTEWLCYVTCFAKIFQLLLFHNTHQQKCYHFFMAYRKNGTQDPGLYEDPEPYKDSGPYEDPGLYENQ